MRIVIEITEERFQEVADCLNEFYNCKITANMIKDTIHDKHLLLEIAENTYHDTCEREEILSLIFENLINMRWPLHGHSESYKQEFYKKAISKNLILE